MNSAEQLALIQAITERWQKVIDPETQADIVRMRLVENLTTDSNGQIRYTFRPSSPLCPIAVYLIQQIKLAAAEVPGVNGQQITVSGYVAAEEVTKLINKEI